MIQLEHMFPDIEYVVILSVYESTGENLSDSISILKDMNGGYCVDFEEKDEERGGRPSFRSMGDVVDRIMEDEYFQELEREMRYEQEGMDLPLYGSYAYHQGEIDSEFFYDDVMSASLGVNRLDERSTVAEENEFQKISKVLDQVGRDIKSKFLSIFNKDTDTKPVDEKERFDLVVSRKRRNKNELIITSESSDDHDHDTPQYFVLEADEPLQRHKK
eukprot:TRINITY_DN7038_c0_g1_i1.p1 TRINITY_DN7038_c0_g1~~TRINITY_DN7038_c0_g1_i1.p1  ORF type:complete len:217 (-),score=44.52 TRINITY_DN7038_c0_g1_i1:195-845(-)